MDGKMTNSEALKAWEKIYAEIDKENWLFVGTINPEMVSLAIKALEEKTKGEWIPVSERLPEEKINPYTTDWGDVQAFKFDTPIIHHKPHFWLGGAIMDEHIIAWQYKPEPYKEGGAE